MGSCCASPSTPIELAPPSGSRWPWGSPPPPPPRGPRAGGLVPALAALLVTDARRASVLRLGLAVAGVGIVVALAAALAPALAADSVGSADRDAVRAVLGVWLDPITAWALAASAAGIVVALAAAAIVRPI